MGLHVLLHFYESLALFAPVYCMQIRMQLVILDITLRQF